MTLQSDTTEQRRKHGLHLVRNETSPEHEVSMHMQSLTNSLSDLCKIAGNDLQGLTLVGRELSDLELTYSRLGLLISALKAGG